MNALAKLLDAFKRSSQGIWKVREMSGSDGAEFFIQAPRHDPKDPYDIEVMGEDVTLYPTRRGDADFIVISHNLMPQILSLIEICDDLRYDTSGPLGSKNKHPCFRVQKEIENISMLVQQIKRST